MSNLYEQDGKVYCGEPYGPTITSTSKNGSSISFSSTCGYAIVNEECNSQYAHKHPGIENTNRR